MQESFELPPGHGGLMHPLTSLGGLQTRPGLNGPGMTGLERVRFPYPQVAEQPDQLDHGPYLHAGMKQT